MTTNLQEQRDPRSTLIAHIDIPNSRVEYSNAPLVLLCGGKVKIKENPDDADPPPASLRHAFTKATLTSPSPLGYELFRPEEITDWQSDGIFKDLMSYETELANICSLVVIILESVGSYTELGAFSQLPGMRKKLIAVCSNNFSLQTSFVNLGILRHIRESNETGVKNYPWDINNPSSITSQTTDDIVADIKEELEKLNKSQKIKVESGAHIVTAICGLLELFIALKEHEILSYLEQLGFDVEKEGLKRSLFLLERFRLIEQKHYSDSIFFFRGKENFHKLRLSLKDGHILDPIRVKADCVAFYKADRKHRNHSRAINANRVQEK